jgi:hypothetical protein
LQTANCPSAAANCRVVSIELRVCMTSMHETGIAIEQSANRLDVSSEDARKIVWVVMVGNV